VRVDGNQVGQQRGKNGGLVIVAAVPVAVLVLFGIFTLRRPTASRLARRVAVLALVMAAAIVGLTTWLAVEFSIHYRF
jgi:hypothetical protein